jgi:anti-sigma factor RsiW
MTHKVHCGDGAALVAYLYGEAAEAERAEMEAHVAGCPRCAAEIDALAGARHRLAAWVPPDAGFDFRLTAPVPASGGGTPAPADAARRGWWAQPLPAWAQLAASIAIFAAGVGLGGSPLLKPAPAPPVTQAGVQTAARAETMPQQPATDLAALESRLRLLESRTPFDAAAIPLDAATRSAIVRQVTLDLERRQPWNRELFNVVVTMSDEFQKDMALLRREAGLDPRMSTLASTDSR